MTIVNEDSSIVIERSFKLIDAARGIIYDRHMFIVGATVISPSLTFALLLSYLPVITTAVRPEPFTFELLD